VQVVQIIMEVRPDAKATDIVLLEDAIK